MSIFVGRIVNIESSVYKDLVGINRKGKFVNLPNRVMRKLKWKDEQDKKLTPNSICIVCNYAFLTKSRGWSDKIKAICHPFRNVSIFGKGKNLYLFSESDWCDSVWMPGLGFCPTKKDYKYEFFIFTLDQIQGTRCKGYYLIPLISKVAQEMGVRGIILDYYNVFPRPSYKKETKYSDGWYTEKIRQDLKEYKHIDILRGVQTQKKITDLMNQSRYVIFPNTRDASPRTIVETLLRGKPCLVNKNIYGGWKYINSDNGMFFNGGTSYHDLIDKPNFYYQEIKKQMQSMHDKIFDNEKIRTNHLCNYGFVNASKKFAEIINGIEGDKRYSYVAYKEFSNVLQKYCM